jgi:Tfp pilus assembly protein PilN
VAPQEPRAVGMERHIQSGVQALIVALLLWVGSSVSDLRTDVAVLKSQMASVDGIRVSIENFDSQLDDHEARLQRIEAMEQLRP